MYEGLARRLITTIFKAKRFSGAQILAVLLRLGKHLRQAWPDIVFIACGDSHFAYPEVMQWIEAQANLSDVTGLSTNAVLNEAAHEVVEQGRAKVFYQRSYCAQGQAENAIKAHKRFFESPPVYLQSEDGRPEGADGVEVYPNAAMRPIDMVLGLSDELV